MLEYLLNDTEMVSHIRESTGVTVSHTTTSDILAHILAEEGAVWLADPVKIEPVLERMEAKIQKHYMSIRTQLPGCTGKCTTYGCPRGVVVNCKTKLGV